MQLSPLKSIQNQSWFSESWVLLLKTSAVGLYKMMKGKSVHVCVKRPLDELSSWYLKYVVRIYIQSFIIPNKRVLGSIKGCGMGLWLVLVSTCFRENVVATCKIGSFLCSIENLLQKNVIVPFFGNQISKWRSFEKKRLFLTYFSHFLVTRENLQKFLQHISHSHTYTYNTLLTFFFALPILKKKIRIYQIRFLFTYGISPGVDAYFFWNNQ